MGKFAHLVERSLQMTQEEFRESMVRAGIYDEDRNLTPKYKRK